MADKDNIKGDVFSVKIDGSEAAFHARVQVGGFLVIHDVTSGKTGADILKSIVQGRGAAIRLEVIERTTADLRLALGLGSGDEALAVGDELPTHTLQIHDETAADDSRDYYFHAVRFGTLSEDKDGLGNAILIVEGVALRDDDGNVWQLGAPAEEE